MGLFNGNVKRLYFSTKNLMPTIKYDIIILNKRKGENKFG